MAPVTVSPTPRDAAPSTVQHCQPMISCLGSDGSSSGARLLPRAPETAERGHKELGFDVPPPNVLARPPTVLPSVEVTTLAAPVAPELVLLLLSFMLGTQKTLMVDRMK